MKSSHYTKLHVREINIVRWPVSQYNSTDTETYSRIRGGRQKEGTLTPAK